MRGFLGLCGLFFFLIAVSVGRSQVIEFLPGAPSIYENGGANGTNISVIVVRTPATGTSIVQYATFDGTANAGSDYIATNDVLTFLEGETFKIINIPVLDDTVPEPSETFGIALSNVSGATLGSNSVAVVTIFDNDTVFQFSPDTAYLVREDVTNAVVTVVRIGDVSGSASVEYFTQNVSAGPADYGGVSGTLLFSNGQDTATILIPITDDCIIETNETFEVHLVNPIGGVVSPVLGIATVTINDNDSLAGRIRINRVTVSPTPPTNLDPLDPLFSPLRPFVRESNTRVVTVYVIRECGTNGALQVDITNSPSSSFGGCSGGDAAVYGQDYTISPRRLVWPDNTTPPDFEQSFDVTIIDDNLVELDETVVLSLVRLRATSGTNQPSFGAASSIPLVIRSDDYATGSADPYYNTITTPGANSEVYAISVVTNSFLGHNGKSIIAGDFTSVNANVRNRIARIHTNGVVDLSFNPGTGADGFIDTIVQQPDGRLLIGGGFTSYNNMSRVGIARLNEDGSLDSSFAPGTGFDGIVTGITIQDDGRMVVVGDFTSYNNIPAKRVVRLLADGTLDDSFNVLEGADATVWSVAQVGPASSPTFYIVGEFTSVNGTARHGVARLNGDGTVDTAFDPAFGADGPVYSLSVDSSGVILVGGFHTFDGQSRRGIVRLLGNGSVDPSFNPGLGVDGAVYDIKVQANGQPIIAGNFGSYNGTPRTNLARLYLDGTVDTSFMDAHYNQGQPGTDGFINSISIDEGGNIMAAGAFTTVGGGSDYLGNGGMLTNAVRPQFNFTRFLGGTNPGARNMPGNVEFISSTYSVDENTLSGNVVIVVRRINGEVGSLWTTFYTENGTAVDGVDFTGVTGSIAWAECDLGLAAFTIPISDNTLVQGNRTFNIVLANPISLGGAAPSWPALGAQTRATVTIVDNDFNHGVLGFTQPVYSADEAGTNAIVTVIRTNGSLGQVSVQYATYDMTATAAGGDYTPVNGTLTFSSGQTNKTISIPIINDLAKEFEEWFGIRMTNATGGATLGASNATVQIYDNDFGPGSISMVSQQLRVSESGTNALITLRRTSGGVGTVAVDFSTYELPLGSGVARAGIDFEVVSNRVVFTPGVLTQVVAIPIISDRFVEGDETLGLSITAVGAASIGLIGTAVLTITDDDAYGSIGFADVNYFIGERATNIVITLVRRGGDSEEVSLDYSTEAVSAMDGADYVGATNSTVVFPDGVRTATITIPILDDDILEGNESLSITLANFQKATPDALTTALLTIVDDESLNAPAGDVDTTFQADPDSFVNAIGLQSNGKLIIGGDFRTINRYAYNRIARLNITGSTDPLFIAGAGANDQVQALLIQPDDKIIIGGRFTTYDATNRARIARLSADGTIDSSFNPGAGADNPVFALALTPDLKVVLGGSFTTVNGINRPNVAVLNTNGSVDMTFNTGAGLNGTVYAIAVQPDGRILIGGDFTSVNNTNRARIARLNPNGSLDLSFNPGLGANAAVRAILVQPDGAILIGGSFTNVGSLNYNYLARLLPNGNVDSSFDIGSGADAAVLALARQPNGKIIAAGDFRFFNGIHRQRLTRLNTDGSIDPTINFGVGANSYIAAVALQPNEQIIIAGGFTEFNGVSRRYVARLVGGENNGAGNFNFYSSVYTANENGTNANITVLRQGGTDGTATVHFGTFDGSALAGTHYSATNGVLTFPPGETIQTFSVPIVNNFSVDGDVVAYLSLDTPSAGAEVGLGSDAALLIFEDDALVSFTSANFSANEAAIGGHATVTIARTGSTNAAVAVAVTTLPGSAAAGQDYTPTNRLVVFAPGETIKEFTVDVFEDGVVEGPETVGLELSYPQIFSPQSSVYVGLANATLTIVDNDFLPGEFTFVVATNLVNESSGYVTVTVVRTNGSSGIVSVRVTLSDLTASSGLDYINASGLLSFADGETVKSFSFLIINDGIIEGIENIQLTLSNPTGGATLGNLTTSYVSILDDESGVQFNSATYAAAEDDGFVRVTVARSGNLAGTATVNFATVPGLATSPEDYLATNGTLVFGSGVSSQFIDIPIVPDVLVETNESFTVVLSAPSPNVQIGSPGTTTVNIQDSARFLAFESSSYIVNEGATNLAITIRRLGLLTRSVSVYLRTREDTAYEGVDYLPYTNIVKFTEGESNKIVLIPIIDDGLSEQSEKFYVDLVSPDRAAVADPSTTSVTIFDNDFGPGMMDIGFNVGLGANKFVRAVALQSDGRVLVGGAFTNFAGVTNRNFLVRVMTNGVFDPTLDIGTGPNAIVSALKYSPQDNRIVVGGAFTNFNGSPMNRLARLDPLGAFDPVFTVASRFDSAINSIEVQADNRMLTAGAFSVPSRGIARIRINGSADLAFDVGAGADAVVHAISALSDGGILVGGAFTNFGGFPYPRVVRLGVNGLVDVTMAPVSITNGVVYAVAPAPDNKIIVGGSFRYINGFPRAGIARLNQDGTLDLTFDPGAGVNGVVYSTAVLADGRVFIAGDFTTVNGETRGRYALLGSDGSVDFEFDSSIGADNTVYCAVVQPDQKIIIGGDFTTVSGITNRGVARINVGAVVPLRLGIPQIASGTVTISVSTIAGNRYVLEAAASMLYDWTPLSTNTATGASMIFVDPNAPAAESRFYRVRRVEP